MVDLVAPDLQKSNSMFQPHRVPNKFSVPVNAFSPNQILSSEVSDKKMAFGGKCEQLGLNVKQKLMFDDRSQKSMTESDK